MKGRAFVGVAVSVAAVAYPRGRTELASGMDPTKPPPPWWNSLPFQLVGSCTTNPIVPGPMFPCTLQYSGSVDVAATSVALMLVTSGNLR